MDPNRDRFRLLTLARCLGAVVMGVIAQAAVDMPAGYFGAADQITFAGGLYAFVLLVSAGFLIAGWRRRWPAVDRLPPYLLALSVGLFVPATPADPPIAGTVVLWNLVLLARHFFPLAPTSLPRPEPAAQDEETRRLLARAPAVRHLAGVSLVLLVAVVGYRLSDRLLAQSVCLVLGLATLLVARRLLVHFARGGSKLALAVPVPAALSLFFLPSPTALGLLAVSELLLLAVLMSHEQSTIEVLRAFYHHPSRLIAASFAAVVLGGALLLTFPAASASGDAIDPLDALFTATSATCVTGLVVLDTPHDFSRFGQVVILGLIQVGGLGIMVVSTFATLLLGGRLGLRGEQAMSEMLGVEAGATANRVVRLVVGVTLGFEAVGALGLGWRFLAAGHELGEAAWLAVFHAVSAFCNAGFALESDSLVSWQQDPWMLGFLMALIVAGGLGFVVMAALATHLAGRGDKLLTVQSKVVLTMTALLAVGGCGLWAALEWRRSLEGLGALDRWLNALFQSVTLRTAGFNSVDFSALAPATLAAMLLFMFIGASPGSTGGGIKTTTVAVLFAAIRSTVLPRRSTTLFGREVEDDIVQRSLVITVISLVFVSLGFFLLLLLEPQPFDHLLFETVSAFGTVGLSLGATAKLGPAGKLVIVALMFIGRIGPLTLALLLGADKRAEPLCRYPRTRLMVG